MVTGKHGFKKKDLTIITTHMNADFDAVASMLAAQKLYPGSLAVFPGSQEENLRTFFMESMAYLFNMADIKDIEFAKIQRLVLVDTKQPNRIGKFSSLLDRSDLEIHIYDHHPRMANDIKGHYEVHRLTGATVSILAKIIREEGIDISPDEATIMCLGIYEDTGSFTFSSTTEEDFTAAAFFLSRGANLNTIANLVEREISPEQVGLLNEMIQSTNKFNIKGVEIAITNVTSEKYVPDIAFLVHKMVKMENLGVIFAVAQMGDKIYIVARSRIPEVNVAEIVSLLGGGGHPYAAAATVKGKTLAQVEQELVKILYNKTKSSKKAVDLMSFPAITASADISCKDANDLLTRYNINALLITEKIDGKDKLSGFISRQIIEKALYHKLDKVPVREYTTTEMGTVGPDSDLLEVQEKIIDNKQRILPVVDKGTIKGVITRTDLLNILVRESQAAAMSSTEVQKEPLHARTRFIRNFMKERIPSRIFDILQSIGEVAGRIGCNAYVVGGFVRDLFLYRTNEDIDIVIEGDGIAFSKQYAAMAGARIHSHEKFGTAVIIFPDGFKIDVASARLEYYKFPAALPTVEMSSIKLDLFRRDFTINTLAVQLNPERFGTLIDFFSAQKDIKEKTIRALHNLSFVEDPTRVFRAIRFEQRFGFTIGKLTSGLIKNAVKMDFFRRLSGRRVFAELRQILSEENPTASIIRLNDYDLLKVIHPSIVLNDELIALFNSVKEVLSWYDLLFLEDTYMKWIVYFLALIRHCERKTSKKICIRLELSYRYTTIFCEDRFEADSCLLWLERNVPVTNSVLYKHLSRLKTELILYMMAASKKEKVKKSISNYVTRLRYVRASIRGKDLIEAGIEPGPVFRQILQAVLDAKLNGLLPSRRDELRFVRDYVSSHD